VSLELEVSRNDNGAVTSFDLNVASIGTSLLAKEFPRDFVTEIRKRSHTSRRRWSSNTALSEYELGNIRYHIQGEFHPCKKADNCAAWASFDHTGHKQCFLNFDLVFICSDKEATIRELRSLYYDLEWECVKELSTHIYVAAADITIAFALSTFTTYVSLTEPIRYDATPVLSVL
jgi:hypothetical protein